MRMRRKKHLNERLNAVSNLIIKRLFATKNLNEDILEKEYIDYSLVFGNDNPVMLEVGCGKGGFILETAKNNPNINYIAVEMLENIIMLAAEQVKNAGLNNVKFINAGAEYLPKYIKDESIDRIFLNFSPPYPQNSYENRRLSGERYALSYKSMLKKGGAVYQKTDDYDFFEYSKKSFAKCGFIVEDVSSNLEKGFNGNVETEYEKKFRSLNMPIYGLKAIKE
ncbi:MAG: tRNA (guanosine(46)-N7)-methyltransferase TrmB [Clostridia bacterium]|nr:tRNA (guanosine(46)-N7)-methyltransferase TrmB [Clostridia bacterium]